MKLTRFLLPLCLLAGSATGDTKNDWPVRKLSFTIKDKTGWTPSSVSVPHGSEVQLTLINKSNAPACFEIAKKKQGQFVKSPVCLDTDETHDVTFFANVDKGSYPIRNRYEQQAAGTFVVE
jgi:hypothetical protein